MATTFQAFTEMLVRISRGEDTEEEFRYDSVSAFQSYTVSEDIVGISTTIYKPVRAEFSFLSLCIPYVYNCLESYHALQKVILNQLCRKTEKFEKHSV